MVLRKNTEHGHPLAAICDGVEFFTGAQAAQFLGVSPDALRQLVLRGALAPGRHGKWSVFTRRDLERYKQNFREALIVGELVRGAHPLDIHQQVPGRVPLREISRVLHQWARVSGVWLVEGPRGSYARWLERYGITRVTPRELRRLVELLLRDPVVGARVAACFSQVPIAARSSSADDLGEPAELEG